MEDSAATPPEDEDSASFKAFKDRTKRRMSQPTVRFHDTRRSSLASSTSSYSSSEEEEEDESISPRLMHITANLEGFRDFCVRDLALHGVGRKEIEIAEQGMAGLLRLAKGSQEEKPFKGAKIAICTHVTAKTAVMVEVLIALGATVRWASCNVYSTQNSVAAAIAKKEIPVFAWRDESEEDFWWCIERICDAEGWSPNLLLDDGGDATYYISKKFPSLLQTSLRGIVENSLPGIHRLYQLSREGKLPQPAMNVHGAVVRSKFDNLYTCKESLLETLKRSVDIMLAGKHVVVCGYGEVGKGCCAILKGIGSHVCVTEIDPICALQASMEGFKVVHLSEVIAKVDLVITATGNKNVVLRKDMEKMKTGAVICNMGHITEIDVQSIRTDDVTWTKLRSEVHQVTFPNQKKIIIIAEGRVANLSCASNSLITASITGTTQILALLEMFTAQAGRYHPGDVYLLPKKMDEYAASLHLANFEAHLTELTDAQAAYLGINKTGPYKPQYYSY